MGFYRWPGRLLVLLLPLCLLSLAQANVGAVPSAASPRAPRPDPLIAAHDLNVGIFYLHRDDYVGALARFQDAIRNDPSLAEAYCRAGDAELGLRQVKAARNQWQRCESIAESGKWARHAEQQLKKHPDTAKP